jgi:hypothetical protein
MHNVFSKLEVNLSAAFRALHGGGVLGFWMSLNADMSMKGLGCFDMSEIDEAFGFEDRLGTILQGHYLAVTSVIITKCTYWQTNLDISYYIL